MHHQQATGAQAASDFGDDAAVVLRLLVVPHRQVQHDVIALTPGQIQHVACPRADAIGQAGRGDGCGRVGQRAGQVHDDGLQLRVMAAEPHGVQAVRAAQVQQAQVAGLDGGVRHEIRPQVLCEGVHVAREQRAELGLQRHALPQGLRRLAGLHGTVQIAHHGPGFMGPQGAGRVVDAASARQPSLGALGVGVTAFAVAKVAQGHQEVGQGAHTFAAGSGLPGQRGGVQRAPGQRFKHPKPRRRHDGRRLHHRHVDVQHGQFGRPRGLADIGLGREVQEQVPRKWPRHSRRPRAPDQGRAY